jgi:uncharacterized membrane protein YfcA
VLVLVGVLMLKGRGNPGSRGAECNRGNATKVVAYGLGSGLVASTGMPMFMAVGTSLVAVTEFGATTAANYAISGLSDSRRRAVDPVRHSRQRQQVG